MTHSNPWDSWAGLRGSTGRTREGTRVPQDGRFISVSALLLTSIAVSASVCADPGAASSWPTDGVGICAGPGEQGRTGIVPDGTGGIFVTWRDARAVTHNDVFVLRITASGAVAAGWPVCGVRACMAPGNQDGGMSVTDGHGGVIVFWEDERSSPIRLFAQRVNAAGALLWGPDGTPVCSAASEQGITSANPDGHGGVFLVWIDSRRAPPPEPPRFHPRYDLFSQRLDSAGVSQWDPAGVPVCADSGDRVGGILADDGADGVIISLADNVRGTYLAQHLSGAGARLWDPDGVPMQRGQGISDGAGGVLIAWSSGDPGNDNVWLQHVDSQAKELLPPGGIPVCNAVFDQRLESRGRSIVSDGAGGMFLTWHDLRNGHDWDIYAQRMLASGAVAPGWPVNGIPVCMVPEFQIYPAIVADGTGGAIISWYDIRNAATGYDIYAQRITATGTIAPGWPTDGVALCTAPGHQVDPIPVPDGVGGLIAYWDDYRGSDVDIYAQHVSAGGIVSSVVTGVETVTLPNMTLEAPRPDPSAPELLVLYSLPSAEQARIALYDVAGREVLSRGLGGVGPGQHRIHLASAASIPSGVYLIRLTQGARSLSRRVAVVH
jgi:hypothetical protein